MNGIFSKNLVRLRKDRSFTQEKLADALGVSFQAVSKWETAQSYPDIELLPRLAGLLETDIGTLLGHAPSRRTSTDYDNRYRSDGFYWGVVPNRMCYDVIRIRPPAVPLRVLDICCGEGRDAVFFANNGYIVSAFDLSDTGLEKGRRLADLNGVDVSFFRADARDFLPDSQFDIIYSSGGFLYFAPERRHEMIDAYKMKTAPGGLAAVNAFAEKPFIARAPDSEDSEHYWLSGELFMCYHDWLFHRCEEVIFDCNSGGVPHKHCMDFLIAEKPEL